MALVTQRFPTCSKCGRPLKDITETVKGVDHYYFKNGTFKLDLPQGRTEDPSEYHCFYCGHPLTYKQKEWFLENKQA